jgi:hypothetical protein
LRLAKTARCSPKGEGEHYTFDAGTTRTKSSPPFATRLDHRNSAASVRQCG